MVLLDALYYLAMILAIGLGAVVLCAAIVLLGLGALTARLIYLGCRGR